MTILTAGAAALRALAEPSDRDCCVFALDVLSRAYALPQPTPDQRALWMIYPDGGRVPASRVWGPPAAAVQAGIATSFAVGVAPRGAGWYLCQGWTRVERDGTVVPDPIRGVTGHTWLWWSITSELGVVLESSRELGVRVDGFEWWSSRASRYLGGVAIAALRPTLR
jgi:hypothetical protein